MKPIDRKNPLNALRDTESKSKAAPRNDGVKKRVSKTIASTRKSPRQVSRVSFVKNEDSENEENQLEDYETNNQEDVSELSGTVIVAIKQEEEEVNRKLGTKGPLKQLSITSFTQAVSSEQIRGKTWQLRLHKYRKFIEVPNIYLIARAQSLQNKPTASQPTRLPDLDDPNNHCRVCKKTFHRLGVYRSHMKKVHKMKLKRLVGVDKDRLHIVPDEDDPNNYCKSCERTFPSRALYRTHLTQSHKMKVKPALKSMHVVEDANDLPEIDDPNFYCRVCDKTLESRKYYRHHITFVHRIMLQPLKRKNQQEDLQPDENDPEKYCQVCELFLSSAHNFYRHLTTIHKMTINKPAKKPKKSTLAIEDGPQPDPQDPNFFCPPCARKFSNIRTFRDHLKLIHKMALAPLKQDPDGIQHTEPDVNDPDFYCRLCDKIFQCKDHYNRHLRSIHKIQVIKKHNINPNADILPDLNDPNYYCRSCDRKYTTIANFRRHLQQIHQMMMSPRVPLTRKNPDITPDLDDPDNRCASCEKTYPDRDKYKKHLKAIHNLFRPSKSRLPVYDPDYQGDINDSENKYCFVCKTIYTTRASYKSHMRLSHSTEENKNTPVFSPAARMNPDVIPDINDPNFHCASCNTTYNRKAAYHQHLSGPRHKMVIPKVRSKINPNITPDIHNPDWICTSCSFKFASRNNFISHLKLLHKMHVPHLPNMKTKKKNDSSGSAQAEEGRSSRELDRPVDTGITCKICKSTHISKWRLWVHMKKIHNVTIKVLVLKCTPKPHIQPDTEDPNTVFCKSCDFTFDSIKIYRKHLIDLHKLEITPLPPAANDEQQPQQEEDEDDEVAIFGQLEIDDPSNCTCRLCEHKFSEHSYFLKHMRDYHDVQVTLKSRVSSARHNVLPDLDDPDSFCKSCNSKFVNRSKYCRHLTCAHGIIAKNPHELTVPDYNDPNFFCRSCKLKHPTKNSYINHLILHHNYKGQVIVEEKEEEEESGDEVEGVKNEDSNSSGMSQGEQQQGGKSSSTKPPDPNDPDFYCTICNFYYSTKMGFQKHLVSEHQVFVPRLGKDTIMKTDEIKDQDIVDSNAYCKLCKCSFTSLHRYRRHVRVIHNVTTPKMIHSVHAENRCIECNVTFKGGFYRDRHMNIFHGNGDDERGGSEQQEEEEEEERETSHGDSSTSPPVEIKVEEEEYK